MEQSVSSRRRFMKKILAITALVAGLSLPGIALANTGAPSPYLEQALSSLPKEKAENFRDAMQQAHDENKDLYGQVHQVREDMHQLLTSDTFDQNAFTAKS